MKIVKSIGTTVALVGAGLWLGTATSAQATVTPWDTLAQVSLSSPLTLSTAGIVGTANGLTGMQTGGFGNGDPNLEMAIAQVLINNSGGTGVVNGTATTGSPASGVSITYSTSSTAYPGGTIDSSATATGNNDALVGSGWEYVIAKYDGQGGGYVLFYLNGEAATLPENPYGFFGTGDGANQISGWTGFDIEGYNPNGGLGSVPEPSTIFAAALLLLPLGMSTFRVIRRAYAV